MQQSLLTKGKEEEEMGQVGKGMREAQISPPRFEFPYLEGAQRPCSKGEEENGIK